METFKKNTTTGEWEKETWVFEYDALDRRIAKYRELSDGLKAEEREFVWDGSHLLQEVYANGRYTYIYTDVGSYEPLAQIHNYTNAENETYQEINYFHCDQIGIPREMTDKDGNLLWFGDYFGWGKLKNETNITNAHQPFRLQNQYFDHETGLHYNFFRYYEPETGRFVNQDPIGLWGGSNFYRFAANSQKWFDPLGLNCSSDAAKLRKNMTDSGIAEPSYPNSAHHIVMSNSKDPKMVALRAKMAGFEEIVDGKKIKGIDINDVDNGVFLPSTKDAKSKCKCSAPAHSTVHTKKYKKEVYKRLKDINDPALFRKELKKIGEELKQGTFPI